MKITKDELSVMAKAYDIASSSLLVIDQFMKVVHINNYAKKILDIKKPASWIGKPLLECWEQAQLPPLLDKNFNLICPKIMVINEHYRVWSKVRVKIDNETHWFLLDKDSSEIHDTYDSLKHEIEKITGHVFEQNLPVNQYVEEIHHFLTNMINRIPCYVYWKNKDLEYIGCNEMAAEFFNLKSPDEVIGKTDFDLFSDKLLAESYRDTDREIIKGGKTILKLPQILVRHNGEVFYTLVSKVPITSEAGTVVGVLGITIDITKEKQAEIAKTDFIANMSHDIRTPLTGVIGLSEILENALVDPLHKEDAHLLYESGNQLLNMLNEILDDVRAGNSNQLDIQEETFDLKQCLENLIKLEAPTVTAKNLHLNAKIDPSVPPFIINDRKKIHHILLNLLGNAIKFTKTGGITLEVKNLKTVESEVTLQFTVIDTGIGIPDDQQDKVFERFFRANPSYKGIYEGYGLGLHIVQSYVSLLGGHINLQSKEGVGTSISFDLVCKIGKKEDLPVIENDKVSAPLDALSLGERDALHFLLVEDNAIALKVLESMLENQGYHFTSAANGEDALELVKSKSFDLIVADIGLPGMSGTELAQHIRNWEESYHQTPTPIVGLTGHAPETARPDCLSCGMNEVFRKPINSASLKIMVEQYAGKTNLSKTSHNPSLLNEEEQLVDLDSVELFDLNDGLKYTNDIALLITVLKDYLSPIVQEDILKMEHAYSDNNWHEIERLAHRVKSGVGCIGTKRLQQACVFIEKYFKTAQQGLLEKSYHQLIKVNEDTMLAVKEWLSKV